MRQIAEQGIDSAVGDNVRQTRCDQFVLAGEGGTLSARLMVASDVPQRVALVRRRRRCTKVPRPTSPEIRPRCFGFGIGARNRADAQAEGCAMSRWGKSRVPGLTGRQ